VFERDGYIEVGVEDIVREAGVARGSFYTYFTSKLDVFRVVSSEVTAVIDQALVTRSGDSRLDPVDALHRSNLRYMAAFRENARIYALIEQLAHIDPDMAHQARARRRNDIDRVSGTIRRWQARGVASPSVDPATTAAALLSMTKNVCFWLYVGGDDEYEEADAAVTINDLWVRAVDLRRSSNPEWLSAR
jgi:AcrR family transcriptional regulator